MTKEQIEEFLERLEGPEGCNFRYGEEGKPETVTWSCGGGKDKTFAEQILEKMGIPQEEAEAFISKCVGYGGHCDCEILFNAAPRLEKELEPKTDLRPVPEGNGLHGK